MSRTRRAALLLSPLIVLSGCGVTRTTNSETSSPSIAVGEPAPTAAPEATFPVTVTAANGAVQIAARPMAIVSLSPTATEMLFAIGAGSQVIAVDDQSNYPPEAPTTALSGFTPNVEAIAAQKPDLVVLANDSQDGIVAALAKLQIPALLLPAAAALQDAYDQLGTLGAATGNIAGATETIDAMKSDIASIVAATPKKNISVYHELDTTLYSAASSTFIGQAYSLLGLKNIADEADTADTGGYPQLSAEAIVSSNPDLIVLADTKCCQESAATAAARPGWANVTAVKNNAIVAADDDIASRWGPRFVDFLRSISDAVKTIP